MGPYDDVLVALRRIIRTTDLHAKELARRTGLTASQVLVLQTVRAAPGATIGAIAAEMNLSQATATTLVDRLEGRGLAERRRNAADRRKVDVSLTAAGRRVLDAAPAMLRDRLQEAFEALAPWQQTHILSALQHLAHLMDADRIDASPVLDVGRLDRAAAAPAMARQAEPSLPSGLHPEKET